jgi:ABC-type cobalamin/Fe3+-siderophores transport system ATPase subunit
MALLLNVSPNRHLGSQPMDERDILAGHLMDQAVAQHQLLDAPEDVIFLHVMLYILAVESLDWSSDKLKNEWRPTDIKNRNFDEYQNRIIGLMDSFGAEQTREWLKSPVYHTLKGIVREAVSALNYDDKLYLFDALFYQLITVAQGFDRRHAEIVAALTNGLARRDGLYDLCFYSGEPQTLHRLIDKGPELYYRGTLATPFKDLVMLRMVLHQIVNPTAANPNDTSFLTLLDVPDAQSLPLSILTEHLSKGGNTQRTLVIFNPSKRGQDENEKQLLRRRLDYDDLLEAVIDFTSFNAKGKPINLCAWLLNTQKFSPTETLCIDARWLVDDDHGVGTEQAVWFAAALCELWASPNKFRINQFPATYLGKLKGLYNQLFESGYVDIDGLCKVLPSTEVVRKPVANRHLPKRVSQHKPSLLDSRSLTDVLERYKDANLCAYVIGNNGAGKSLLLSSLVDHFDRRNRVSIGIAFGPTDRFPLPEQTEYSWFRYLGGRTAQGYSSRHVESELISLLAQVFAQPERLAVLEDVLAQMDFSRAMYLVPRGVADAVLRTHEHARRVVPLTGATGLTKKAQSSKELALQRHDTNRFIRFAHLSSGEQQILLLLGKIVSAAEPGSVLLVDEPEISLHVQWQQRLPALFTLMAQQLKCSFVIATHSPTLIANAQDESSHCFLAIDQGLSPIPPEQRHSVETILLNGFATYTPHNREIAERCAALVTEAVRATNREHRPNLLQQEALLKELRLMAEVMKNSGNSEDQRFRQDKLLIEQAHAAINEAYMLADQEVEA